MRFLADENFPGDAVTALRAAGHDVLWIRTDAPGITDQDVLARSFQDARVLLTCTEYMCGGASFVQAEYSANDLLHERLCQRFP
jgi:hypothetical protein